MFSLLLCLVAVLRLLGTLSATSDPTRVIPSVIALVIVGIPGFVGFLLILFGKKR
jgi:hypothetical protein